MVTFCRSIYALWTQMLETKNHHKYVRILFFPCFLRLPYPLSGILIIVFSISQPHKTTFLPVFLKASHTYKQDLNLVSFLYTVIPNITLDA